MEVKVLFEKKYATYMYSFTVKSVATLILVISKSNAFLKLQINPAFDTTKKVRANTLIHLGLLIHNWLFMDRHPY